MKKELLLASAVAFLAMPVYADETVTSETTVQRVVPKTYSKTVTEETSSAHTVESAGSVPADVAPDKPYTTSKTESMTQKNSRGDQRKVVTKQTVNGDGYMAKEEYHEEKNY